MSLSHSNNIRKIPVGGSFYTSSHFDNLININGMTFAREGHIETNSDNYDTSVFPNDIIASTASSVVGLGGTSRTAYDMAISSNNNTIIACGAYQVIIISLDGGMTWSVLDTSTTSTNIYQSIDTDGNGKWVVCGSIAAAATIKYITTDTGTFTSSAALPITANLGMVKYVDGRWFASTAVASTNLLYSDDMINWTLVTLPQSRVVNTIFKIGSRLIAIVNTANSYLYSDNNGVSWTHNNTEMPLTVAPANFKSAGYNNGVIIIPVTGISGAGFAILRGTSMDSLNLISISSDAASVAPQSIYFRNNVWYVLGGSSIVYYSVDNGLTWANANNIANQVTALTSRALLYIPKLNGILTCANIGNSLTSGVNGVLIPIISGAGITDESTLRNGIVKYMRIK